MIVQHIFSDENGLNPAKEYPGCIQTVGLHAQTHDLPHSGIPDEVIRYLDCDFHRGLGSTFVPLVVICVVRLAWTVSKATCFLSTLGSAIAYVAYPVGRFDVPHRPLDVFVPDFGTLSLSEPRHQRAFGNHHWSAN